MLGFLGPHKVKFLGIITDFIDHTKVWVIYIAWVWERLSSLGRLCFSSWFLWNLSKHFQHQSWFWLLWFFLPTSITCTRCAYTDAIQIITFFCTQYFLASKFWSPLITQWFIIDILLFCASAWTLRIHIWITYYFTNGHLERWNSI